MNALIEPTLMYGCSILSGVKFNLFVIIHDNDTAVDEEDGCQEHDHYGDCYTDNYYLHDVQLDDDDDENDDNTDNYGDDADDDDDDDDGDDYDEEEE